MTSDLIRHGLGKLGMGNDEVAALTRAALARIDALERERDEARAQESLLVNLWRSPAFAAEGEEGDIAHRSPCENAVEILKRQHDLIAHLKIAEAGLMKEVKTLTLKTRNSLANNLCPDHRDKQQGKPCLACTEETLRREREKAEAALQVAMSVADKEKERGDNLKAKCEKAEAERDRLKDGSLFAVMERIGRACLADRDELGRHVRTAWIEWARTQPNPKPSWLVPYSQLSEADKEADRMIGEYIANIVGCAKAGEVAAAESAARLAALRAENERLEREWQERLNVERQERHRIIAEKKEAAARLAECQKAMREARWAMPCLKLAARDCDCVCCQVSRCLAECLQSTERKGGKPASEADKAFLSGNLPGYVAAKAAELDAEATQAPLPDPCKECGGSGGFFHKPGCKEAARLKKLITGTTAPKEEAVSEFPSMEHSIEEVVAKKTATVQSRLAKAEELLRDIHRGPFTGQVNCIEVIVKKEAWDDIDAFLAANPEDAPNPALVEAFLDAGEERRKAERADTAPQRAESGTPDPDRGKVVRDAITKMGCQLIHRGPQVWTLSNERFKAIYDAVAAKVRREGMEEAARIVERMGYVASGQDQIESHTELR